MGGGTILERIKTIEEEIGRTQKNKATTTHLGSLRAKLCKLRRELLEPAPGSGGGGNEGFDVSKTGDARVALIGFPSVGKSTILSEFTSTKSEAAAYEFTTLTCIPGVLMHRGCKIQILDLPGIIEGASQGKGRGRQVIAVAKSADMVLMVLDASSGKSEQQRRLLERELEVCGLRLNKRPPNISFKKKSTGGISVNFMAKAPSITEKDIYDVLHEYRIHNADVLIKEDLTVDDLCDVIEANRHYVKCLYVYNKIDHTSIEEVERICSQPHCTVLSTYMKLNYDGLVEQIWEYLELVRVYTKKRGQPPDLADPLVLTSGRHGVSVEAACLQLHKSLVENHDYTFVWGRSVKHSPQRCGLSHALQDEDVVQIMVNKVQSKESDPFNKSQAAPTQSRQQVKKAKKPLKT
jgi:small GTP-binding protein